MTTTDPRLVAHLRLGVDPAIGMDDTALISALGAALQVARAARDHLRAENRALRLVADAAEEVSNWLAQADGGSPALEDLDTALDALGGFYTGTITAGTVGT